MQDKILVIVSKKIIPEIAGYYAKHFSGWNKIIVSPDSKGEFVCSIETVNDNFYLRYDDVKSKLSGLRVGWYYQQFLKYSIVLNRPERYVLIVDGDSVLSDGIDFSCLYSTMRTVPSSYRSFNKEMLGPDFGEEKRSFITNQMMFDSLILKDMIGQLGGSDTWIDKVVTILKKNSNMHFSEYQMYAEYCLIRNNGKYKKLRVFRRFDCISEGMDAGLKKYNLLAYEYQHKTGLLRKLRAKVLYWLGRELG